MWRNLWPILHKKIIINRSFSWFWIKYCLFSVVFTPASKFLKNISKLYPHIWSNIFEHFPQPQSTKALPKIPNSSFYFTVESGIYFLLFVTHINTHIIILIFKILLQKHLAVTLTLRSHSSIPPQNSQFLHLTPSSWAPPQPHSLLILLFFCVVRVFFGNILSF